MRFKIGMIIMITGISIIVASLYMRLETYQKQQLMIEEFNREVFILKQEENIISSIPGEKEAKDLYLSEFTYNVIGILSIPKIGLMAAIVEGTDEDSLKTAVGHIKDTAHAGEIGNCVIAGHRSYSYNEFFNRLDEVEINDRFIVKRRNGEFSYSVYEKRIVYPDDSCILEKTSESVVTLVTCHPERSSEYRMIVKGRLSN